MKAILTKTVEIKKNEEYRSYEGFPKELGIEQHIVTVRLFNIPIYKRVKSLLK